MTNQELPRWSLSNARARLSELVDKCLSDGPQIITRRGEDVAVAVSVNEWQQLLEAEAIQQSRRYDPLAR